MIKIQATNSTPRVFLNTESGELEIMGRSYPENALDFWKPIIEEVSNVSSRNFSVKIGFEYLNTSSSKFLYGLLKIFEKKHKVEFIEWLYEEEDEDMEDLAKAFSEEISLPFRILKTVSF